MNYILQNQLFAVILLAVAIVGALWHFNKRVRYKTVNIYTARGHKKFQSLRNKGWDVESIENGKARLSYTPALMYKKFRPLKHA